MIVDTDIVDGSPILDIKPYLPTFDRIEDAITPDWVMQKATLRNVHFTEEAICELKALEGHFKYYKSAEEMYEVLLQVFRADVSKRSDRRVSEFQFDCLSVLFTAQEGAITIEHVLLASEYAKQH